MAGTSKRKVICRNCASATRHLLATLEPILWLQSISSEDGTCINYACPECRQLTRSRVESESEVFQDVDPKKFPEELNVHVVFLNCASPDCESPVILLAPVKKDITDAGLMTHIQESWRAHSATCANGNPPKYPLKVSIWKQLESDR